MLDKILSIIVPAYNMEAYLPKCLESLIIDDNDLLQKLDIVVVNDGSKDRTSEIAHSFESKYAGIFRVIDKPNGNYGSCINVALKSVCGSFVKILDADDSYDKESLSKLLRIMILSENDEENIDLFLTDFVSLALDGHEIQLYTFSLQSDAIIDVCDLNHIPLLYMHAVAYRTENLKRISYEQTEKISYTDNEWVYYPMSTVRRLRYEHIVVYKYLIGRQGQTISPDAIKKSTWILAEIAKRMINNPDVIKSSEIYSIKQYLQEFVVMMCVKVYNSVIIDLNNNQDNSKLIDFDSLLKLSSLDLYQLVIDKLVSKKIRFHYGQYWIQKKSSNTFKLILFRFYVKIVLRRICKFKNSKKITKFYCYL